MLLDLNFALKDQALLEDKKCVHRVHVSMRSNMYVVSAGVTKPFFSLL